MKVWIAILALLLLLALIFRERYTNYEEAIKDVGQTAGYITPKCPDGFTMNSDESSCEKTKEDGTKETKPPTCPSGSSFTTNGPRGVCEPSAETPVAETLAPTGGSSGVLPKCMVDGFTLKSGTADCQRIKEDGTVELKGARCPDGKVWTRNGPPPMCVDPSSRVPPSGPGPTGSGSQTSSIPAPAQTAATSTPTTSVTSTSTGGTSGNLIGPNSGGVGKTGKNVWGPIFTGVGESSGQGGDSTKSNKYPGLLGGMMGRQTARVDGVGITSTSQPGLTTSGGFGLDMGALPSLSSLGTEANARFLPFSRPGADPGLTADPYRLAKGYSTKNLSPTPEPVPFLTDFSAFFK